MTHGGVHTLDAAWMSASACGLLCLLASVKISEYANTVHTYVYMYASVYPHDPPVHTYVYMYVSVYPHNPPVHTYVYMYTVKYSTLHIQYTTYVFIGN